jgi:hypothetical protein
MDRIRTPANLLPAGPPRVRLPRLGAAQTPLVLSLGYRVTVRLTRRPEDTANGHCKTLEQSHRNRAVELDVDRGGSGSHRAARTHARR